MQNSRLKNTNLILLSWIPLLHVCIFDTLALLILTFCTLNRLLGQYTIFSLLSGKLHVGINSALMRPEIHLAILGLLIARIPIPVLIMHGKIKQGYLHIVMPMLILQILNMECFQVLWAKVLSQLHSSRSSSFVCGGACCSLGSNPHHDIFPFASVFLNHLPCMDQLVPLSFQF